MIKEILEPLSFDSKATILFVSGLVCVCCFILGFTFGASLVSESQKTKAIKAGIAEYQLDKTTGTVTFQYITPCKTF